MFGQIRHDRQGNKIDKMYWIKYLFKQNIFGSNSSSVLQYVP